MFNSHANLDIRMRSVKAEKIKLLVENSLSFENKSMLEVGTGSGIIAAYFSQLGYGHENTYAVDVVDERQVKECFNFRLVDDVLLPFPDNSFNFVISNHVIEHVGSSEKQVRHLAEIYRVLEPGGVFYFAVPNRWRLVEPHYKLLLLSWLPKKASSAYVRLFKLGSHYDCLPFSHKEAIVLLRQSGFDYTDVTLDVIPLMGEIEGGWFIRAITVLPKWFWRLFSVIMPTLIFVCRKPSF